MPAASPPLVLGASGQVGYFLLQRLGRDVIAVARNIPSWSSGERCRWRCLDLWTATAPPASAQLISAGPLDGCVAWLERVGAGELQRIVALSSMSAVHKQDSPDAVERVLAARLREHEQRLFAFAERSGIACTLLRPTLIWGGGLDRSLTPYAQRAARRGFAFIPAAARGLRQPVHADDLAAICIALLARTSGRAAPLELGGGERLPLAEMLARCARSVDARALRLPLPRALLAAAGAAASRLGFESGAVAVRALTDQCADSEAAWREFGITARGFVPVAADFRPPAGAAA
ncbi:MAG: NAD(P)-dependent oxidoreductase [Xanthomonadales bacterium]|nr:NAD(P)-dependent oxidoreductase [Xanthomonadales bacterium]